MLCQNNMDEELQDDLIGSIMADDDAVAPQAKIEDMVEAIDGEAGAAHGRYCEYRPFVNQYGIVFCLTCGSTVGSINDISDSFCPKCGCANSAHLNGKCLMLVEGQPCPCSDAHEFRSTSFDTQTKEAKKWLKQREAQRERHRQSEGTPTS
jgi:hypothetical protein